MQVQDIHERSLRKSTILSGFEMDKVIAPLDVVRVLNAAKIRFVLVGAYGLAGWRKEPRATEDVDVIVAAKQVKKAVKALCEAFPELEPVDLPMVVRLRVRGTADVAIDLMKPLQAPHRDVFKHTHAVESGGQRYRVPSLEMAVTMKFSSMTSLYRADRDRYQDAHDFILLVENNPDLDAEKLLGLGSLLYPDGGKDLLEAVRRVRAGEKLNI
ncbi:MAG TPA: nucleotidyl transferase AbiEii/AbiGii toxin family protein [Gemmataceae bacterium]|nr:nucleotidyl transferase AbiEii/AbiGii toxin family protein [Gemmataceae bacterium]